MLLAVIPPAQATPGPQSAGKSPRRFVLRSAPPTASQQADFAFEDLDDKSLKLSYRGKPVMVYNHGLITNPRVPASDHRRSRACYVHPLWGLQGEELTDDFPPDHYHHHGIFWTWPHVGIDGKQHDLWAGNTIFQRLVKWLDRQTGSTAAVLGVENGWFVGDRQVVREEVEIVVHRTSGHTRALEFGLAFEAVGEPVEIGGEQLDRKGYGGFSVRFAPRTGTRIVTEAGAETRDTDMARHRWAQLEALYEGRPATLRIEIDPENPGFPNGWCLRHYGFLGVNYPGLETYTLVPGKPLRLRYRVTVSAGMPSN
ncbi:MAG: PmoA family protein, partial [Bryobacteraceae bacterium]|nr:PmoA family protein [Bryobacteraceae bacterium]